MKYKILQEILSAGKTGSMTVFGNSMLPIIQSGSKLNFIAQSEYEVGDIVFCKVNGRFIDAHLIKKKDGDRYLIGNNHGGVNGWTRKIYGKVLRD